MTEKICIDCIHYRNNKQLSGFEQISGLDHTCHRICERARTNLITGNPQYINIKSCREERYSTDKNRCGTKGVFYKKAATLTISEIL